MERVVRRLLYYPAHFTYGALALSLAVTLPKGFRSTDEAALFGALVVAYVAWVQLWVRRRAQDPVPSRIVAPRPRPRQSRTHVRFSNHCSILWRTVPARQPRGRRGPRRRPALQ